jgi:pyruvate dehydrogenase E1 component
MVTSIVSHRISDQVVDIDPEETAEWVESIQSVIQVQGKNRARFLLAKQLELAAELGVGFPGSVTTPYLNSISPGQEPLFPR